jgi:hypothetical protein
MKTNFQTFDVADSMAAAASRLDVPLEVVKQAKRQGCTAFKGSRVHLRELVEAMAPMKGPSTAEVLLSITEEVARIVAAKLVLCKDARFRTDSRKLTVAIHEGFGAALLVVEPDKGDDFLRKSSALFENIFKPTRKSCRESSNSEKNGSES